jgi:hypothetical protein
VTISPSELTEGKLMMMPKGVAMLNEQVEAARDGMQRIPLRGRS